MTTLSQELIDQGLQLAPEERERFANLLLDSLEGEEAEDPELQAEIQRRWDRYERGEERAYSLEEVMTALRKQAEDRKS
ncbi:MAG: addiction module protein [Gemmataceae bacterium]|nr:addiction module protein [Gemmataceae bacterium]